MDARHTFLAEKLAASFELAEETVHVAIRRNIDRIDSFFDINGPRTLGWTCEGGQLILADTCGNLRGKLIAFSKPSSETKVLESNLLRSVYVTQFPENMLQGLHTILKDIVAPSIASSQDEEGFNSGAREEALYGVHNFVLALDHALSSQQRSISLRSPNMVLLDKVGDECDAKAFHKASTDPTLSEHFRTLLSEWIGIIITVIDSLNCITTDDLESGLDAELYHWRTHKAQLGSIQEHLDLPESRVVIGVGTAASSSLEKKWKEAALNLSTAAKDAQESLDYLRSLQKGTQKLTYSAFEKIPEVIPGVLSAATLIHSASCHYSKINPYARLLRRIAGILVRRSKEYIMTGGKLWDQPRSALLEKCTLVMNVHTLFINQALPSLGKAGPTKMSNLEKDPAYKYFSEYQLLSRRVQKLHELLASAQQFETLTSGPHIVGLQKIVMSFSELFASFKAERLDLLDVSSQSLFDTKFLDFQVKLNDLELELQQLLRSVFENAAMVDQALAWLRRFDGILSRPSFVKEMEIMYVAAFQRYAVYLQKLQHKYEKHKSHPPNSNGLPPVAAAISWARTLLNNIEAPMQHFLRRSSILDGKDSKKIIQTYNRLAQALIEFETLHYSGWLKGIESVCLTTSAPLLARHPTKPNKIVVNFDQSIMQLMSETEHLAALGFQVPENACALLQQRKLLMTHYSQLKRLTSTLSDVQGVVDVMVAPLIQPHMEKVLASFLPGLTLLTWNSLNIDGFIESVKSALKGLRELLSRVTDCNVNRIKANIERISQHVLVLLLTEEECTCEVYWEKQNEYVKKQVESIAVRSADVNRACSDLLDLVACTDDSTAAAFKQHCGDAIIDALSRALLLSLRKFRQRLGQVCPLFAIELQLVVPSITPYPPLSTVQSTISDVSASMLECMKQLYSWWSSPSMCIYDIVSSNGAVNVGMTEVSNSAMKDLKAVVADCSAQYQHLSFLWTQNPQEEYEAFVSSNPSQWEHKLQLQLFLDIEKSLATMPLEICAGAVSLKTLGLHSVLRGEVCTWKSTFGSSLHHKALTEMSSLEERLKSLGDRLPTQAVTLLEEVGPVLDILQVIRDLEMEWDRLFSQVEEEYAVLASYAVTVLADEVDRLERLPVRWKKLLSSAQAANASLLAQKNLLMGILESGTESFIAEDGKFISDWNTNGPMVDGLDPLEASERLCKFQRNIESRLRRKAIYTIGHQLFGSRPLDYPGLSHVERQISLLEPLYSLYIDVLSAAKTYGAQLWSDIVPQLPVLAADIGEFTKRSKKLARGLNEWQPQKDCRKAVEDLQEMVPLLQGLALDAIKPRHWDELGKICNYQFTTSKVRFKDLLDAKIASYKDLVEDLCNCAVKEGAVELKISSIITQWKAECFSFADHKSKEGSLLRPTETAELKDRLEDSLMTLNSLTASRYSLPYRQDLQEWTQKLSGIAEILDQWLSVQNLWVYLEAVFSGGDIVKQLPAEAKRFANIDKGYMKIVKHANATLNCLDTCLGTDLLRSLLPELLEQLELSQKSLSAYLESKRSKFPRFYFVSDPTLLEILSLGSDPAAVVPHLQSGLFDSLSNVNFDKADKNRITEMISKEGERVKLEAPVEARGNVETWLQRLVDGMQDTIKAIIRKAATEVHEKSLDDFIFNNPAQVSLIGLQFKWTAEQQAALYGAAKQEKGALTKAFKKADGVLRELVSLTLRADLNRIQRTNLETCITVHMHQKEASEDLLRKKVRDPLDFEWLKQVRMAWRPDKDTVIASICDVDFEYSYEYLGVKERLVITPLTDICYITLTQALGMFLGGAPAGPAGTGKTETTKDLGATLGKYVVVFNCSDQMDYKGMGKIYKGLAQSGLWGCFDEFNRINLDVLSVCAQQIHCVLTAIREQRKTFTFTDGSVVPLDPRVGYFITMNPGYAGRQELPENLKVLFRGVTMMVPNRQIIIKVKLAACGYQDNDILSKKFFVLYALCEQQLSKQPHYDFGLRNILSVLRTAGASKRSAPPDKSEVYLLMRTLRDMNMSKFVAEDVPLFLSLIEDLFPGEKAERSLFGGLNTALEKTVRERGLQCHPNWINKCIQIYETQLVRHGIMVVGPSGSGKSSAIDCLAAALTEMGSKTVVWKMNPKAITAPQMFGKLDAATGDWTDGVFAVLWRRAAKAKNQNTWIVLDGPVDAIWIENLNTVLDDNKVLTLANGDRILMNPNMKLFFEVENLNNASPATVSRAGIIYLSDSELGWQPLVASWLESRPERQSSMLRSCFDKYTAPLADVVKQKCKPVIANEDVCQIGTLLTLLSAILQAGGEALSWNVTTQDRIERVFLFCCAWSLGGLLDRDDRVRFDAALRTLTALAPAPLESGDTIFEFLVNENTGEWQHWRERVPEWKYPSDGASSRPQFSKLIVPTLDSVRYEYLLTLVHSVGKSSLLIGGPGTAKTTTVNQFLSSFNKETHVSKTITFSYLTTPGILQNAVEGSMEKRQGRSYGPPSGRNMTIFVDDMSMPATNQWGDQITNEALRQLLDQGGLYALEKPIGDFKCIVDTRIVGAMTTPGNGKIGIPNRLKRHFAIFNVPPPSSAAVNILFGRIMQGRFTDQAHSVAQLAQDLVPLTMTLWGEVQTRMLPTPSKFHYVFSLRDLSKIFQGMLLAQPDHFSDKGGSLGRLTSAEGYLLALWAHECMRVFADKLVSSEEKQWVWTTIQTVVEEKLPESISEQLSIPAHFVDFLRDAPIDPVTGEPLGPRPSCYETALDGLPEIRMRVENMMEKMNSETKGSKFELVLFDDALEHLLRISRLLCMERGHALLVGVGGSGKQSLAKLAAAISGARTFQISSAKLYGVANFLEDIRGLFKDASLKGQPIVFILTDSDIRDEAFLEYINQLLMTGDVAGLFSREEMDALLNDARPVMKKEYPGLPDTHDNLFAFVMSRARSLIHVALCFSPVGPRLSKWAQQFPGLVNGCTIDWFLPWPKEALTAVSNRLLGTFQMESSQKAALSVFLQQAMASIHNRVTSACGDYMLRYRRTAHVTPRSFLSFIAMFKELYANKFCMNRGTANALILGLEKMSQAKVDVKTMQVELGDKDRELIQANAELETLLAKITNSTYTAEEEKEKVAIIVEGVTQKASEIAEVKWEAEKDLAEAQPALDAAVAALNSITPKDITALKALKNPPDIIKRIFDCVLLLRYLPLKPVAWHDVKGVQVIVGTYEEAVKMMGDITFLQSLVKFPKEQMNDETVELLQPYFNAPDFNYQSAKKASGNVAGLCNWARSMCDYHQVAKFVGPKIAKLRQAEAELSVATKEREAAEADLAVVQGRLDEMQKEFNAAMTHKKGLEDDAASTRRKMANATALISALGGEEARWSQQCAALDESLRVLVADCVLASSFVSYLGPFNRKFREELMNDFTEICSSFGVEGTKNLALNGFLAEETEVGQWAVEGLPTDDLSIQNGILVSRASRYPLLIDPQGQGRAWLTKKEASAGLVMTQTNDKRFRTQLENCLIHGTPLLIENVEEDVDPSLDVILEKKWVQKGSQLVLVLGDKEIDVSPNFRLYLTTRLPNPRFSPELSARVTIVDFTVTRAGLEDQLLGRLILREKGELEEQRQQLIADVQSYRKKINDLESDLLQRLSSSTGNLLDDTALIDILAVTKATAQEVLSRLESTSKTRQRITEACEEYRAVARRAMLLYFLVADFANVNCMYQTSLSQFLELYEKSIDRSEKAATAAERTQKIVSYLTDAAFNYIQMGLFQRHKIVFALMLANNILVDEGNIPASAVDAFLKLGAALELRNTPKRPKDWIPEAVWLNVIALSQNFDIFSELPAQLASAEGGPAWKRWYDTEAPENAAVPNFDNLDLFHKMCLIRAVRGDRTLIAASEFICETLGPTCSDPLPIKLDEVLIDLKPTCPIICLLSPGADPSKSIEDLAKSRQTKTLGVSMGQGQEVIARRLLTQAAVEGHWLLLQNAHLGLAYMIEVERWLSEASNVHANFRLWITSESHPSFPIGLLQKGFKMTNEAPVGLRACLRASLQNVSQDLLESVNRKEWKPLVFATCFFHATVQERRKYGPIGWNVPYEFNHSDLSASLQFLQNHLQDIEARKTASPDWATIRYMVASIQYGGRITDDFDRSLIETYAQHFYTKEIAMPGFNIFKDSTTGAVYSLPDSTADLEHIRKSVDELPGTERPELFGLHSNADITFRHIQVQEALQLMLDIQPKDGFASEGQSIEDMVSKISTDLLRDLPDQFEDAAVREKIKKHPNTPSQQPLVIHLRQEIDRLNTVISVVSQTLRSLQLAIAGAIALNDDLAAVMDALYCARAPLKWVKIGWEAATLGSWWQVLLGRHSQLSKWLHHGRPHSFWLGGFFNPQGFLTAVKQEISRRHAGDKWALDDVVLISEVTRMPDVNAVRDAPSEGVYIHGLIVEGGGWSLKDNKLCDPEVKKLYQTLPVIHVTACLAKDKKTLGYYEAPCYKVARRTAANFISTFMLKTDEDRSKWVLRGTALLCAAE